MLGYDDLSDPQFSNASFPILGVPFMKSLNRYMNFAFLAVSLAITGSAGATSISITNPGFDYTTWSSTNAASTNTNTGGFCWGANDTSPVAFYDVSTLKPRYGAGVGLVQRFSNGVGRFAVRPFGQLFPSQQLPRNQQTPSAFAILETFAAPPSPAPFNPTERTRFPPRSTRFPAIGLRTPTSS